MGKLSLGLPLRNDPGERVGEAYLPLEALRDEDFGARLHGLRDLARIFRSSGTTREARSLVRFSRAGLECYRQQSLYAFFHVLSDVLQRPPWGVTGVSLVPPVTTWPESSLAQMVAWIAELVPVRYTTEDQLETTLAQLQQERRESGQDDQPIWLFGTAFHLVNVFDQGLAAPALQLPAGSVVFETGGTKGRTRSVTRDELYADITRHLGVAEARIVSEYGMCELAAQAYDFRSPKERDISLARRFRFPAWVDAQVLTAPGIIVSRGEGALCVEDPLRLDAPWTIRTEDRVALNEGGFTLLGRLPTAPLKGCSLLAEAVLAPDASGSASARTPKTLTPTRARFAARGALVDAALRHFLQAPATLTALTAELGSATAARAAAADIAGGLPETSQAWGEATRAAVGDGDVPEHWLYILPENHSLVGLYPLALGYAAGLAMTVRLPRRFAAANTALGLWLEALRQLPDARISTLAPEFRVRDDAHGFAAVLVYGDDATVASLKATAGVPVQGFGSRFAMSLVTAGALTGRDANAVADSLAKDALSLGQRGCLSARLIVVGDDGDTPPEDLTAVLAAAGRRFWRAPLAPLARIGLDLECWRYAALGFSVRLGDDAEPLVATRQLAWDELTPAFIEQVLAQREFALPVLIVRQKDPHEFVKTALALSIRHPGLTAVTLPRPFSEAFPDLFLTKSDYGSLSFRELGHMNTLFWNGRHEGRPLFVLTSL